jgi:hypothetical protein
VYLWHYFFMQKIELKMAREEIERLKGGPKSP